MTAREWKPGDVAMVRVGTGDWEHGVRRDDGTWGCQHTRNGFADHDVATRPLVVIDPDDEVAAFRLIDLYFTGGADHHNARAMQRALRSYIAEPKPEEPTALWSVVRDGRHTYVRTDTTASYPWEPVGAIEPPHTERRSWVEFSDAVQVLSTGGA